MPVTFPHLPDFADSFMQGASTAQGIFESLQRSRLAKQQATEAEQLFPTKKALMEAQTQEASGKGAQSQMLANILSGNDTQNAPQNTTPIGSQPATPDQLSQLTPGMKQGDEVPVDANQLQQAGVKVGGQGVPSGGNSQKMNLAAALMHILTPAGEGKIYNPLTGQTTQIGESPEEKTAREVKADRQKSFNAQDAKTESGMEQSAITGGSAANTVNELTDLVNSPIWKSIHPLPIGNNKQVQFKENLGSKEQKDAIGKFDALQGQLVKEGASGFKGSFRGFENNLLNTMKPTRSDPIAVQQGKLKAFKQFIEFNKNRQQLAANLVRNSGLSPADAIEQADKQLHGDLVRKVYGTQFGKDAIPGAQEVRVSAPNGKVYRLSKDNADKLLKDHPDHKLVTDNG